MLKDVAESSGPIFQSDGTNASPSISIRTSDVVNDELHPVVFILQLVLGVLGKEREVDMKINSST